MSSTIFIRFQMGARLNNSNKTASASGVVSTESVFIWRLLHVSLLFQQLIGDDQFLNFRSAFIDSERARVAIQSLDGRSAYQAGPAVNLYCLVDNLARRFGREHLCLAGLARRGAGSRIFQISGPINQQSRCIKVG